MQEKDLINKINNSIQRLSNSLIDQGLQSYSAFGIWALTAYASLSLPEKDIPHDVNELIGLNRDELTLSLSRLDQALPQEVSFALASWISQSKLSSSLTDLQNASKDFATNYQHSPKQGEADAWINEKSFSIFEEFPANVEQGDAWGLLASLIAMDIKWKNNFEIKKDRTMSTVWGVEKTLFSSDASVEFYTRDKESYLAVYGKTNGDYNVKISNYTFVSPEGYSAKTLQKEVADFESNSTSHTRISQSQAYATDSTPFTQAPKNAVSLPAWDVSTSFGVDGLVPQLNKIYALILDDGDCPETTQAVKASYNAEGFKAAAVTFSMLRAVAAMPQDTYCFKFTNPFITKAFADIDDDEICLFDFLITKEDAVEAFLSDKG